MELLWLEDFIAVGKLRSFSRAAAVRHATQSALSRRIKALEAWYGVPLLDRSTYPITLTQAGTGLMPVGEHLVAELYRARRDARASAGAAGRVIRFAMPHSLAVSFFPRWWRDERREDDLCAKVHAADLSECIELLLNGSCQYLLHYTSPDVPSGLENVNLQRWHIGSDRLVPVSGVDREGRPRHVLSSKQETPLALLSYPEESFLGRVTSRMRARLDSHYCTTLRYESALVEALKAEALGGEGLAWLPESIVVNEMMANTLQRCGDESFSIPLDIWLCAPPLQPASLNALHFRNICLI